MPDVIMTQRGRTARAQVRIARVTARVLVPLPAARALGSARLFDRDPQLVRVGAALDGDLRDDEQVRQLALVRPQEGPLVRRRLQDDPRVERFAPLRAELL